jgi:hypothetical protein
VAVPEDSDSGRSAGDDGAAVSKETLMANPARVVVWSTGGVGSVAIDAIRLRPDLELVGVWVHSPDKVGKDVGELSGGLRRVCGQWSGT